MRKKTLYRSVIALAILLVSACTTFIVSASSAYAAGTSQKPTTVTKTQLVLAPTRVCNFLKKSEPSKATDPHICTFKLTTTDVSTQTSPSVANACYVGSTNHTATYTDITLTYGYSQTTHFAWYGNCAAPTIISHSCGSWGLVGASTSVARCFEYPNGTGHTQAEEDVNVSIALGAGNFTAYLYSDGISNGQIIDWWA